MALSKCDELCNLLERGHVRNHVLKPRLDEIISVLTVSDKTEEIMFKFDKRNYIYGTRFLPEYFVKTGKTQPNMKI